MKNETARSFIVIDDDPVNNILCKRIIAAVFPDANIKTFTEPKTALAEIEQMRNIPGTAHTVILLDVSMPVLSGWDVLKLFDSFPDVIKQGSRIFLLSSSISRDDKSRAEQIDLVLGFIEKPLTMQQVREL